MTDFTLKATLTANVEDFTRNIKAGAGAFRTEMEGVARATETSMSRTRAAMQRLNVRPFRQIDVEIRRLQRDYQMLARSGELSARALTQANIRMQEGVRKLAAEKNGWVQVIGQARGGLLGLTAAGAGLVAMLYGASRSASAFRTNMAEVSTLLDTAPAQMAALSAEVRALAVDMGIDAAGAAKSLYDIISAGVPEGSAIEVLRKSARAAVAGVTDTQTAARVGLAAVNAYRLEIGELGRVYDILFETVRGGVTTLPELAASIGQVLPVAAAAKVPLEQVTAAIAEMTKAGLRTPMAVTGLRGAITALSTPVPEAAKQMDELGIVWDGLANTLRRIAQLQLDPETLRAIVPDVEARTAVLALTGNIDGLTRSIDQMANSAGAADAAYAKMADTPEKRMREFRAAVGELALQLGDLVAAGTPVVELLTGLARSAAELPAPIKQLILAVAALTAAKVAWAAGLRQVWDALRLVMSGMGGRIALWGAAAAAVLAVVDAHLEYKRALREIADERRKFEEQQQQIIDDNRDYVDVQVLTREEIERLSTAEQRAYQERLRASEAYHRAQLQLIARREAQERGITAPASDEALGAAREARIRHQALQALDRILARREEMERSHKDTLARIKDEETTAIRDELAKQIRAYDSATKALETAQQRRAQMEQRFAQLRERIAGAGQTKGGSFLDIATDFLAPARQAAAGGNFEKALQLVEQGADALAELVESGDVAQLPALGLLRQLEAVGKRAAAAAEAGEAAKVAAIKAKMDELVSKAEFLKHLEVGFDVAGAEASADQLRTLLQQKLAQNPIVIPVVLQEPDAAEKKADELLKDLPGKAGGGPIQGPGTETSDSVLARLSHGEYVIRAAAVRKYGSALFAGLNRMTLPRFAGGGLIGGLRIPAPAALQGTAAANGTPLHLHLDGREFRASAPSDVAGELARAIGAEARKRGRRL